MEIFYSSKFLREYKKLSIDIKRSAEKTEKIFRQNPYDPRLKTHKLTGPLNDFWAFSVTHSYRIGSHDIYS
jgi:mRNA-degrading endonuclease YafQ of YafQ-DinJ toxin-antitoxin module